MLSDKTSNSQTEWALLARSVGSCRLELHRLRKLADAALHLVEESAHREHFYQVAGDIIVAIPDVLGKAEQQMDETCYALASIGKEDLKETMALPPRMRVDKALEDAPDLKGSQKISSEVADRYLSSTTRNGKVRLW